MINLLKAKYSFANHNMSLDDQEILCQLIKKQTTYPPYQRHSLSECRGHSPARTWDKKEFKDEGDRHQTRPLY